MRVVGSPRPGTTRRSLRSATRSSHAVIGVSNRCVIGVRPAGGERVRLPTPELAIRRYATAGVEPLGKPQLRSSETR